MKMFNIQYSVFKSQHGQSLVTLLFIMVIAITIISAAAVVVMENTSSVSVAEQGTLAYYAAEGAIENSLLRYLRDKTYTGETITIGNATVTVQITGGYATASAVLGKVIRKIQVQTVYNNGSVAISSWKEL